MNYSSIKIGFLFLILLAAACHKKDIEPVVQVTISNEIVTLNPTGYAPLTATITFETSINTKVTIRVQGKYGEASDVVKDIDELNTIHSIPVLGLYADFENTVELIFKNNSGAETGRKTYLIKTLPLPADVYPVITIDKKTDAMAGGMTLVSYFGYKTSFSPHNPFVFDAFGDIRWYLDLRTSPQLNTLLYEDGMERLQNGNLYFGNANTDKIYEMDMLGKIINV
ncbi:MAG TPA: aryl-sulfate sulfotransferase, partial [Chitinophagaceae bacterium]